MQTQSANPYRMQRVRAAYVEVIGTLWMPGSLGSTRYELSNYDLENIGEFTRDNVEQWLCTHSGDFQSVKDFSAVCGNTLLEWADEESEFQFADCMYQEED